MANPVPNFNGSAQSPDESGIPIFEDADYSPILSNWFTAKPYGFRYTPKNGNRSTVMYLPINPSNIIVSTNFATNIITTIYGTVEEHSPVRYYDITIEGTTGIGPQYIVPIQDGNAITPNKGRTSFAIQQSFSTLAAGFFAKTLQTAENVINSSKNIINSISSPSTVSGLQLDQTGYYAFHNLYRFLLKYKKNTSGAESISAEEPRTTNKPPLVFFNYKDNNEYTVVIRSFTLRRDKDNPMLYFYSISMRGYDLKSANSSDLVNGDQSASALQAALGLDGVKGSTFLSTAKTISSQTKSVLSSVANGINQLGR